MTLMTAAIAFGLIAAVAERSRAGGARAAQTQTEPLLVEAVALNTALSDANATAATTFLTGGLEPPALRARYLHDLRQAGDALAAVTRGTDTSSAARAAAQRISEQLPVYSGLVEAARANNRQGFPVGAAYLRHASSLLTGTILPEADHLYAIEASRLSEDYATGTSTMAFVVFAVVAAIALGLMIASQVYVFRVSHRIINVPMAVATVALAVASIWAIAGLLNEGSTLSRAKRDGSDSVEVLSATRVLLSRAESDQSLTLVNRGSDVTDPLDFARVMKVLAPPHGLIGAMGTFTPAATRAQTNELRGAFSEYQREAARINAEEQKAGVGNAITIALAPRSAAVARRLSANLSAATANGQARFSTAASDATSALAGLSAGIPALAVIAAALSLLGIRQRLSEYR